MNDVVAKMIRLSGKSSIAGAGTFHEKVSGGTWYSEEYRRHFYPPDTHWDQYVVACVGAKHPEVFLPFYVDEETATQQWRRVCKKIGVKVTQIPTFVCTADPRLWQERIERVFFDPAHVILESRTWSFSTPGLSLSVTRGDSMVLTETQVWKPLWDRWLPSQHDLMTPVDFQWFKKCLGTDAIWRSLQLIMRHLPVQLFDMECRHVDILIVRHLYHHAALHHALPIMTGVRMWNQGDWFLRILCILLRSQWPTLRIHG